MSLNFPDSAWLADNPKCSWRVAFLPTRNFWQKRGQIQCLPVSAQTLGSTFDARWQWISNVRGNFDFRPQLDNNKSALEIPWLRTFRMWPNGAVCGLFCLTSGAFLAVFQTLFTSCLHLRLSWQWWQKQKLEFKNFPKPNFQIPITISSCNCWPFKNFCRKIRISLLLFLHCLKKANFYCVSLPRLFSAASKQLAEKNSLRNWKSSAPKSKLETCTLLKKSWRVEQNSSLWITGAGRFELEFWRGFGQAYTFHAFLTLGLSWLRLRALSSSAKLVPLNCKSLESSETLLAIRPNSMHHCKPCSISNSSSINCCLYEKWICKQSIY